MDSSGLHRTILGVCSWSLNPASPAELAASVRAAGLNACQLALVPLIEDPGPWGSAVHILRDSGVTVLSGMLATIGEDYSTLESIRETGGLVQDRLWRQNADRAQRVAAAAADNGILLVTLHAGFLPHDRADSRRSILLDRLRTVGEIFGRHDIDLAFETGQETAETLLDVLDDLGSPTVGVNFDPANMILYGMGEPVDALRRLAPHVRQIHIKDALPTHTPGTWGSEVAVGTGAVDWAAFFAAVRSMDRQVDLVIEREAGSCRLKDIQSAADLIRTYLS